MNKKSVFFRLCVGLLFLVAFALTIFGIAEQARRDGLRALMHVGLETVAQRIEMTSRNLKAIKAMNDAALLAKARAFARVLAADPSMLNDQARFESYLRFLDVDELHVSDGRGILIKSLPVSNVGFDMASTEQSRPFMAAIGDPAFEFVQEPMAKGSDRLPFQYAGVARLDAPGIVQVGQRAQRVADAMKMADVNDIAKTARIGRDGSVRIGSSIGKHPVRDRFRVIGNGSDRVQELTTDVSDYRVTVSMPASSFLFADHVPFTCLCVVDAILVLLLLSAFVPGLRRAMLVNFRALGVLMGGVDGDGGQIRRPRRSLLRRVFSPVFVASLVLFVVSVAVIWYVTYHSARREAEDRLRHAAADMRGEVNDCVDQLLYYVGHAIVNHYKTPEAIPPNIMAELRSSYSLDELNVVNDKGIIISAVPEDIGFDMASTPTTSEFNCLLRGRKTYSQPFRNSICDPSLRRKFVGVAFPETGIGYIEMGFDEWRVRDDLGYWFDNVALGWHVGESGYFVVAKSDTGEINSCGKTQPDGSPVDVRGKTLAEIGFDVADVPKIRGEFFTCELFGEKCLCLSDTVCFHRVVTVVPMKEIVSGCVKTVVTSAFALFAVFALVIFFMTRLTELVRRLKGYIAADRKNRDKDLQMAKAIQFAALPEDLPDRPNYTLKARMWTAREVGGDFFDHYPLVNGLVFFMIADVAGKGIPAAMFMMRARTLIKASVHLEKDLATAVSVASARLAVKNDTFTFVTAWMGTFNRETGHIAFVNAGHNPPLVRRADGRMVLIGEKSGPALAVSEDARFRQYELTLEHGESIFLYTDGVTEAMNRSGEQYGLERLMADLSEVKDDPISEIRAKVAAFADGAEQSDDITILALYRK